MLVLPQAADAPHAGDAENNGYLFDDRARLGDVQATATVLLSRSVMPLLNTTSLAETRTRVREVRRRVVRVFGCFPHVLRPWQVARDGTVPVPYVGEHVKILGDTGVWYGICLEVGSESQMTDGVATIVDYVRVQVGFCAHLSVFFT